MTELIPEARSQPASLKILFFSEMWERFSFYGLKALLVLYMIKELSFNDGAAYKIIGTYSSLVYASLILGGYLTDKFLGFNKAIIFGAILITLGHFSLAIGKGFIFYLGLGLIITGTGFFKGNITSLLGKFYNQNDPRRDAGFTFFYMGINIGGLLAPILCGYFAHVYGWHFGFGIAGIGMLIGLVTFINGIKTFEGKGSKEDSNSFINLIIYIGAFVAAPILAYLVQNYIYMGKALPLIGILTLTYIGKIFLDSNSIEKENIFTLALMMMFVLIFLAFWEQIASSLTIFTDRHTNREFDFININGSKEIPTPWIQSLNPIFVLLLAPILSFIWGRFEKKGYKIYTPFKFVISFLLLSLGFLCFKQGASFAVLNGKTHIIWVILGYMFYTAGELAILPIGYAMVTKLAPHNKSSAFMGIWFMGFAFAQYIAAIVAQFTATTNSKGDNWSLNDGAVLFHNLFSKISLISFLTAVILSFISIFTIKVFKRVE